MSRLLSISLFFLSLSGALVSCDALRYFGPEPGEQEAMERRLAELKEADDPAFVVYPIRRGDGVDADGAACLAALIEERCLGSAGALERGPWFELRPSMNEQSHLWEMARDFRAHVRANPPAKGYALYADYFLSEKDRAVHAVHFAVCDRAGEWVLVDFQNSHHDDFREIAPRTQRDCDELVVTRMARALSGKD